VLLDRYCRWVVGQELADTLEVEWCITLLVQAVVPAEAEEGQGSQTEASYPAQSYGLRLHANSKRSAWHDAASDFRPKLGDDAWALEVATQVRETRLPHLGVIPI
jgi:hypothetical protein